MDGLPEDGQDPSARLKKLASGGASRLQSLAPASVSLHDEFKSGNLARRMATENAQEQDALPNAGTEALGAIAATGRDIPGVEAAQAGASALVNGVPYRQALQTIREAEDASTLGTPARLAGATLATMALPGSAMVQGATYGGLRGVLDADPNKGAGDRLKQGALEAALDSIMGKAGETGITALRGLASPTTDQLAVKAGTALRAKTTPLYDAAEVEARGTQNIPQPIHPAVGQTLADPNIKPWVDEVRASPAFQAGEFGPPDALTALKQVYKNMGEAQRTGLARISGSDQYRPMTQQDVADLTTLKQRLSDAASHNMPSWVDANREFAQGKAAQETVQQGAKVGRRIVSGQQTPLPQLESSSPASLLRDIPSMSPAEATSTTQGLLSALKGAKPQNLRGALTMRSSRNATQFLRALDRQSGNLTPELAQALGITGADLQTHP